ncbi:hypothetical protein N7532_007129 [Penicillium argentinense]|uniref:Nitronate monooxygenase domain-containing protein n=1 Tax=Penicillium argentinense TaxID=1131581 RepID=A0A9W9FHA9_9EURO|nr:uncharacterized protein N7532_007129 [Penicillium argentinense]KAJ5100128.1 hypothetical protein N7532_007129 [Penicillium argentinense]
MSLLTSLKEYLPWIQPPLIINAPMSGIAKKQASRCPGGLGQIGYLDDLHALANELEIVKQSLHESNLNVSKPLPIGLGVIVFGSPLEAWLKLFAKYKPAVAWLSFADTKELQEWTEAIRRCSPETRAWVQLGSVRAAVDVARACRPDALVLQGSDAGGHGHESGASVISLIPEVADALSDHGIDGLPLIAAGGIIDGRGCAAALALGASGVVMGTRFLAAEETSIPAIYRDAIFEASDGGEATARSRVFDEIWGPNLWPETYDGRCLKNKVYEQHRSGVDINQIRAWLFSSMNNPAAERLGPKDMGSIWAGTGVGLVKKQDKAEVIVQGVRSNTHRCLERAYLYMG